MTDHRGDEPTEADPPTGRRDAIQDAVYDELAPYIVDPDIEQQEDLEQLRDNVTDAVWRLVGPLLAEVKQSQVDAFRDLLRMRALVGRPAAPTREQIHDAIADALSEHVWAHGTGEIDGDGIGEAADAVVALLSRSAEPPDDQERERVRVELTPDNLDGGYVGEVTSLPGCVSQGDTVPDALVNLADAYAAIKGGVAAEPKEHGDGR